MKVLKNFLYNVGYQILIMILPLITAPYIARVLGAESIGIYSYTYSIAYYFVLFGQLGLSVYGNRTIAFVRDNQEKLSKAFLSLYFLQFTISLISTICYIVYVSLFVKQYTIFMWIQSLYVFSSIFDISWFYFGMEKFKLTVIRNILVKLVSVILILMLVKTKNDLIIYTLIMAASTLIGQISLWIKMKKYVKFKKISFADCKPHLKPVIILFLPTIATSLYRVLDKIMLGSFSDISQLGYFENSEKFISISMGIVNALGTVMIPQISNLVSNGNTKKIDEYLKKSMEGIFIIASSLAFGLAGISDVLSVVFYGKDFINCTNIISILALSLFFSAWANVIRTQYLVPNKKDKEYIISMFFGAGVNILLNIILIPQIGALGAAVATVFAEISVSCSQSFFVKKNLELRKYLIMIFPYIIFGGIMYISLKIIRNFIQINLFGLLSLIILGAIIYITIVLLYFIISKSQYYYILKDFFIKRKKSNLD